MLYVYMCLGSGGAVSFGEKVWAWVWKDGVVICLCELLFWILCAKGRYMYMYIVLCRYLMCTQCSIMLLFIDIGFLSRIYLWQI